MKYVRRVLRDPDLWFEEVRNPGNKPGNIRVKLQLMNTGPKTHTTYVADLDMSLWKLNSLVRQAREIIDRQIAGLQEERSKLG